MVLNNELQKYIEELLDLKKDETDQLHKSLKEDKRPIIFRDVARFIKQIVLLRQPQKILEIGTNTGYSAIILAQNSTADCEIKTIDINEDNLIIAKKNFEKFNLKPKIRPLLGNALALLNDLKENFDLIFIDADKINNLNYLKYAVSHLNQNGVILIDNLLWKGRVYSDDQRKSTLSIQEFNKFFMQMKDFETSILSIGDGLGFAVKKQN